LPPGDNAGGGVEREKDHDDQGRNDPQGMASVLEAFLEVVRDGDRIVSNLGVHAQARRYEAIVEVGADHQADGDPRRAVSRQQKSRRAGP
jgi:hypothetical protein